MANTFVFSDFNQATIGSALSPTSTSLTLATGAGALYPNPSAGQQFALILNDQATRLQFEVVYCTARSGDNLVIVRGQEGTTPKSWSIGDFCWCGPTAGQVGAMVQIPAMTNGSISPVFAVATANSGDIAGVDAGGLNFRAIGGTYGAGIRNDGASVYLLQTASGSPYSSYNSFRPYAWNLATGAVSIDGTGAGASFGGNVSIAGSFAASNGITAGGAASVGSSLTVGGNATVDGDTFFGSSGQFFINPNASGAQLINFASGNYLEFSFASGGFLLVSTGNVNIVSPGGFFVSSGITSQGNVQGATVESANGNVTANNGRLRASFGARGGDGATACLLNDFSTGSSPGVYFYEILPDLSLFQSMSVSLPASAGVHYVVLPVGYSGGFTPMVCWAGNSPPSPSAQITIQPVGLTEVAITLSGSIPIASAAYLHTMGR